MSQITMTIIDPKRAIHSQPHGSFLDEVVAALSADPETIEELEAAMERFVQYGGDGPFAGWASGIDDQPYDAGVCIVDLGARLVVADSTYSVPMRAGELQYRPEGGREEDTPWIAFHLADDWGLRFDTVDWDAEADARREKRLASGTFDFRKVLYDEVCPFIVEQCFAARGELSDSGESSDPGGWTPPSGWTFTELPERVADDGLPLAEHAIAEIHARWLMTPRDDLRGQTPRDVLLAGRDHIDRDLWSRCNQWSAFRACPPPLSRESAAFRFGPCGTHENVMYYEMVRDLIRTCWRSVVESAEGDGKTSASGGVSRDDEIARLREVQQEWLETPDFDDLGPHPPLKVIELERMRIPMVDSGDEAMVDPDCPLCQMMADESKFGPSFWHLDGCNMDQDYPFTFCSTREEWETEYGDLGALDFDYDEPDEIETEQETLDATERPATENSVWNCSSMAGDVASRPLPVALFSIGAHVAEIGLSLRDSSDTRSYMESLNRHFGNLRSALQDGGSSLVDPVVARFVEELHAVREVRPELDAKCSALGHELREFAARLADQGDDWGDADDWNGGSPL